VDPADLSGYPDAALVAETVDHLAINRLQSAYADTVTRRDWPTLSELFLHDAVLHLDTVTRDPMEVIGPAAIGEFIGGAVERFDFFEFVALNSLVTLAVEGDRDAASGRTFMCELRRNVSDGAWTTAYGLYRDRYRRVDGRWWFAGRDYRSLARTGEDGGVFPFPDLPVTP
jgi:hypothetical protein